MILLTDLASGRVSFESLRRRAPICHICSKPLAGPAHPEELPTVNEKTVHESCYYAELGALVEAHPVPGAIRWRN